MRQYFFLASIQQIKIILHLDIIISKQINPYCLIHIHQRSPFIIRRTQLTEIQRVFHGKIKNSVYIGEDKMEKAVMIQVIIALQMLTMENIRDQGRFQKGCTSQILQMQDLLRLTEKVKYRKLIALTKLLINLKLKAKCSNIFL